MIALIENNISKIISLCKKHQVKSLALFGSAVNNTMSSSSDLDFLVQFSDELAILDYADNYFSLLEALQEITGKSIDLVSLKSLKNPILKEEIFNTKVDLYAA